MQQAFNMRALFFTAVICSLIFFGSCKNKKGTDSDPKKDTLTSLHYELHDFESVQDASRVDSTKGLSGKICGVVTDKIEYGYGFDKQMKEIASFNNVEEINVAFNCWMDKKYPDDVFVLSIDDTVGKKNVLWEGRAIEPAKMNEWSPVKINYKIKKEFLNPEYILKLYIWNKGKNTFYFDDLEFSFVQKKK
jgi:hypothetical protein